MPSVGEALATRSSVMGASDASVETIARRQSPPTSLGQVRPYDLAMRILDTSELDPSLYRALSSVTLYLTPDEASHLAASLEALVDDPVESHHLHLTESDDIGVNADGVTIGRVVREVTVAVYVDENLNQFDVRSRRLIETGE